MPGAGRPSPSGSAHWKDQAEKWRAKEASGSGNSMADHFQDIRSWLGGEDKSVMHGDEEEAQGLLGLAHKGMHSVAERAGNAAGNMGANLGGNMGTAMQVAAIGRQRWLGFAALLVIGCILMSLSFACLPLIVLAPHKFAFVFTSGSLCFFGAFSVLKGTNAFIAHLFSRERLWLSMGYLGSMAGTLWASLWYRSTLLTMVFSAVQISELLWFFVSYIPGGSSLLGVVCEGLRALLRKCCWSCCVRGIHVPI